jgi:hypothetical protein
MKKKFLEALLKLDKGDGVATARLQCVMDLVNSWEKAREAEFWRFVCMPQIEITVNSFSINWNNNRYDTLTPALEYDNKLIDLCREYDFSPSINLIIDDWELLFLREKDKVKTWSRKSLNRFIDKEIPRIRNQVRDWIENSLEWNQGVYSILFFSEFVDYEDLLTEIKMRRVTLSVSKDLVKEETNFVLEIGDFNNRNRACEAAKTRVAQYSSEMKFLRESKQICDVVYLGSEYPTGLVYRKLSSDKDFPALFYADDKDLKNV